MAFTSVRIEKYRMEARRQQRQHRIGFWVLAVFSAANAVFFMMLLPPEWMKLSDLERMLVFGYIIFLALLLIGSAAHISGLVRKEEEILRLAEGLPSLCGQIGFRVEEGDNETYYKGICLCGADLWKVTFAAPAWDFKRYHGQKVSGEIFFNPEHARPLFIATDKDEIAIIESYKKESGQGLPGELLWIRHGFS